MTQPITWLSETDPFPPVELAGKEHDPYPGLLAAGGRLDADSLQSAYSHGIFPWFSADQPILWWSPDPRMVLQVRNFRLHDSLRKTIKKFRKDARLEVRIDSAFEQVIRNCSLTPRPGQDGTWIVDNIIQAYTELHMRGKAHSVETWVDGQLVGGLYCVALGRAVFGESMFAHATDASKIALAALVGLCRTQGAPQIDCQQATRHLASLGAREMPRKDFLLEVEKQLAHADMDWQFDSVYWDAILASPSDAA